MPIATHPPRLPRRLPWLFAALLLAGCSLPSRPAAPPVSPDADTDTGRVVRSRPGNAYYHYTAAQLKRGRGDLTAAIDHLRQAIDLDPASAYLRLELALTLLQNRQPTAALETVEELLDEHPDHTNGLILYGRIHQGLKQIDEAKRAYIKVLARDPDQKNIYLVLGDLYLDQQELDAALAVFQRMIRRFPDSHLGHFFLGRVYAAQQKEVEAESALMRCLELAPEFDEARFALIGIYRRTLDSHEVVTVAAGDTISTLSHSYYGHWDRDIERTVLRLNPELRDLNTLKPGQRLRFPRTELMEKPFVRATLENKVVAQYQEMLGHNPRNYRAAMELAAFNHLIGRRAQASAALSELGAKSAGELEILRQFVSLYLETKQFGIALVIIDGMLRGAPQSPELHYLAGIVLEGLARPEEALAHLREVSAGSTFFDDAVIQIASLLQGQDKRAEAIAYLERVVADHTQEADFYLVLGTLYEEDKNFAKAEQSLQQGMRLEPENTRLLFRLGVVFDKAGRKEESIAVMQEVVRIDPKHAHALNYLGYSWAELGIHLQQAEEYIRQALTQQPDDGYITDSLGWVLFKQGRLEEALKLLLRAAELVPDDPVILEHLGDVYRQLEQRDKAREFYRRSLDRRSTTEERQVIEGKLRELSG
jgi:tetratricopeptide (TPR) repeat protein